MKARTITLAGSIVIVVLLFTTGKELISNSKNRRNYNIEKAQNEDLVAENLRVTQELDKAKSDLTDITSKGESATKELAKAESTLAEKERSIDHISKENVSMRKEWNELSQLQKSKIDLDRAYEVLKLENQTALSRITKLENSAIAFDAEKRDLVSKLESSEKYRTDNIEVYGSRGNKNDSPTFVARKTKDLNLTFETPLSNIDPITVKIITPSGSVINPENKLSAWVVVDHTPENMTASLSSASIEPEHLRKIKLIDNAKDRLKPGEYKIGIYSNDKNIGNYRLKLM